MKPRRGRGCVLLSLLLQLVHLRRGARALAPVACASSACNLAGRRSACASLAHASLGDGISVLSAVETSTRATSGVVGHRRLFSSTVAEPGAGGGGGDAGDAPETCTLQKDVDIGDSSTILASFKGLVDHDECCAACYANPECTVSVVLVSPKVSGCWLKTGAGTAYAYKNATACRTTRAPGRAAPTAAPTRASKQSGTVRSYCLVEVLVQPAIHIYVGLPSDGAYNERFMSLGGGGFAGSLDKPIKAVAAGYAGATTDTGHTGSVMDGSFGMLRPGAPNVPLQTDFAWRSEHMMAVVGKQLVGLFFGRQPRFSYWNGCSTGGRQGLAMAQRFPDDYQGILAGAPAIHFEKLGLGQTWPQVPMLVENGGKAIEPSKLARARSAAIAACDMLDGVKDSVIRDARQCEYSARALVPSGALSEAEAAAIDEIWAGPRNLDGSRSWYGLPRGAPFGPLAGPSLAAVAADQAKYWVEFDAAWDYRAALSSYAGFAAFYDKTCRTMTPGPMPTADPDIADFRDRGHKILMWHGWADGHIMPQGSIDYFEQVRKWTDGGNLTRTREWMRLFMAPGVRHCRMDKQGYFDALVAWVEQGVAPESVLHHIGATTRPLCPHPLVAVYKGVGSTHDAASFECGPNPVGPDTEDCNERVNQRLFGLPFLGEPPAAQT